MMERNESGLWRSVFDSIDVPIASDVVLPQKEEQKGEMKLCGS